MKKKAFIGAALLGSVLILFLFIWNGERKQARVLLPPEEQVITIHGESLPQQPDSLLAIDPASQTILSHLYEGLYRFGSDGSIEPGLVETLTRSDDGATYTFSLKESKAANHSITASTFVEQFRKLADIETNSPFSFLLEDVSNGKAVSLGTAEPETLGVRAVDDYTLEISLNRPIEGFERILAMPVFLPQTNLGQWQELDGNGPFKIESLDKKQITLIKNDTYYETERVTLEKIVIQEQPAREGMHVIPYGTPDQDMTYGGDVVNVSRSGVFYLKPNIAQYPFNDSEFRRAIALTINRENIAKYLGRAEQVTDRLLVTDNEASQANITGEADEVLDLVKKRLNEKKIEIELLSFIDEEARGISESIKTDLEKLPGLSVSIIEMPLGDKVKKEIIGDYMLSLSGWQPDYPSLSAYLTQFETENYLNSSGYNNESFDRIMRQARDEEALWERNATYRQAEKHLLENAVVIPIYQAGKSYVVDNKYAEIGYPSIGPSYVLSSSKVYEK